VRQITGSHGRPSDAAESLPRGIDPVHGTNRSVVWARPFKVMGIGDKPIYLCLQRLHQKKIQSRKPAQSIWRWCTKTGRKIVGQHGSRTCGKNHCSLRADPSRCRGHCCFSRRLATVMDEPTGGMGYTITSDSVTSRSIFAQGAASRRFKLNQRKYLAMLRKPAVKHPVPAGTEQATRRHLQSGFCRTRLSSRQKKVSG